MTDKLPEIMQSLSKQMGREPEPTVTRLEDYAPKPKDPVEIKSEQISEGLREIVNRLRAVQLANREKLDQQAELLAKLGNIVAEMEATVM